MVSAPALLFRLRLLRASFLLGIPREFHTMSQFRHRLREAFQRHGSVRLPTLIWNRYVHSHIGGRNITQQMVIRQLLLDHAVPVRRTQRRFHHGVRVVGQHGRREGKQRRTRIAQGFDLATKHVGQRLERSLNRPACPVSLSRLQRRSLLGRQVGQDRISVSPLSVGWSRQSVIRRAERVAPSKCSSIFLTVTDFGGGS